MRWNLIKKAMEMAKDVLRRQDVWADFPPRLFTSGEIEVFSQSDMKPVGEIHYQQRPSGPNVVVVMSLGNRREEIKLPRSKRLSIKALPQRENLRPILMNNGDAGLKILADAARTKNLSGDGAIKWAIDGGLTESEAKRIVAVADQKQEEKKDFERSDRVRITGPCMEFGELAWVMGKQNTKKGSFYLVLVDGSSSPILVPGDWLKANEAGAVQNA